VIAWFVLPVKSSNVLGRRVKACMGALRDARLVAPDAPEEFAQHQRQFAEHLAQLELVAPSFYAHRRLHEFRGLKGRHPADAVDALRACAEPRKIIAARESQDTVTSALREIGLSMRVVGEGYGANRDHAAKSPARERNA